MAEARQKLKILMPTAYAKPASRASHEILGGLHSLGCMMAMVVSLSLCGPNKCCISGKDGASCWLS